MNVNKLKYILIISIIGLIILNCEEKLPTWEDPNPSGATTPTISSVEPDTTFGGESVIIRGIDFNPNPLKNFVAFGKSAVEPDSANDSTLYVTTPTVGGMDYMSVKLKVTVDGCEYWSNELDFTFPPILSTFRDDFSNTRGIEFDQDGNCYVGDPDDWAIYKITPTGDKSVYAWTSGPGDLVFDRDGYLYVCNRWDDEIYRVDQAGNEELFTDQISAPFCIDMDDDGNMYVVSKWNDIYRITPGMDISALGIECTNPQSVRVFEGYLYWSDAGDWGDGYNRIMKAPITPTGIGDAEAVYEDADWTGTFIWGPSGINIDTKGNVYAVSQWWDGNKNLAKFTPDGSGQVIVELPTSNNKFIAFWDKCVYITTQWEGVIYKVYVGEDGAPPYAWGP
jgi:hypothetical protein